MHTLALIDDAKTALAVTAKIIALPVLSPADREELRKINRHAYRVVAETVEELIGILDGVAGDPDLEEVGTEDSFGDHSLSAGVWAYGPGCDISDPGGCEHDGCEHDGCEIEEGC